MRQVIIVVMGFILGSVFFQVVNHAHSKEVPKKEDNLVCVSNAELDKSMKDKSFGVLLSMTNENKVVETVWVSGQSITITAAVPNEDKSCLLAVMSDVTYNPNAIEQIYEIYKKQTKQKDI